MLEGKKVKLAFHVVIVNCYGNLDVSSIVLEATLPCNRINVYVEIPLNHHP
jgi:hypothetical protein